MKSPLERLIAGGKPAASPAPTNDIREIEDPTNLRSPVGVQHYVGIGSGDYGCSVDSASDHEAEAALGEVLQSLGYQGSSPQAPDLRVVNAAAAQLKSQRGF